MRATYEKLDIIPFGKHLLETGDLDPIYYIGKLELDTRQLKRWLVAYWCFYSAGLASYASESTDAEFWAVLDMAARNVAPAPHGGRWERGHERRHCRGAQGIKCVQELAKKYMASPETMVSACAFHELEEPLTCGMVMESAQSHYLFGPWIGFKVADMLERVLQIPVSFAESEVFMFDQPKEAALLLWRRMFKQPESAQPRDLKAVLQGIVAHLGKAFEGIQAPPHRDRAVNLQEIETILCKWKSHLNGHYPLLNDTREITANLELWKSHSNVARRFHALFERLGE